MTTSADLFELVFAALAPDPVSPDSPPPTAAGDNVDRPGIVPTQSDQYPRISVRMISETKQSQGRGSIGFITSTTIRVVGVASAPVSIDDVRVSMIEAKIWQLKAQIERAIINSYPLFSSVQQLASVQTQLAFDAQATMLAGVQSDYTFEIYEDADDFAPIPADVLDEITAHLPGNGPGFTAALQF